MWYEIFKFEIRYRVRRLDTYLFFAVIFLFSVVAFNFTYEGQSLGLVKENAPYIIAKITAIVSGIFMILASMIMGVPVIRDFQHNMTSILFVNPITKRDYLLGRFLGSYTVLVFIFSGIIWGLILGNYMPWRDDNNLLPLNFWHYIKPFILFVLPTLFFAGSIFFISGALSKKMIVVYTQGLFFFLASILSFSIENDFISSIIEPLSFSAIDDVVQSWAPAEQNIRSVPLEGAILYNRLIWMLISTIVIVKGYATFNFNVIQDQSPKKALKVSDHENKSTRAVIKIPEFNFVNGLTTDYIQLKAHSFFYFKSNLKEASFWVIALSGAATICINSVNIGTTFGVDSFPTTYLILEELKEMSLYFFLIILVMFSGELIWKEREARINGIYDALPISNFTNLTGKFVGLILTYAVLLFVLMIAGIAFQTFKGYYNYDLNVYFTGLFLEVFPFLILFTFLSFFFQVITNSKFIGHILFAIFFIIMMFFQISGWNHGLYSFGGISLEVYSDMNGYGHFLRPYLWFKLYWFAFGVFLFVISVIFNIRGTETGFRNRWKLSKNRLTKPMIKLGAAAITVLIITGGYIFYNTNILNNYLSNNAQEVFRAAYEQTLKEYEYLVQPKIVDVNLNLDLYPKDRAYVVEGYYVLENKGIAPIGEIHVQKVLTDQEKLEYVQFEGGASLNSKHKNFGYSIYTLNHKLQPGDSIRMDFKQKAESRGFKGSNNSTHMVENGTFFDNDKFPSLGYNRNYELRKDKVRKRHGLGLRPCKAKRDDINELVNGRSGDDGSKIHFEMTISTDPDQIAIVPGTLQKEWIENGRKYFHYKMDKTMINFYSIVSARYEVMRDQWLSHPDSLFTTVDLELYYNKGHEYNLNRMMNSMKKSLDYFNEHFSPYPHRQLRVMEYPQYEQFAQSFPNTIPFSEAIGFVLDIDDEKDIDIPFFITSHELAHQWWGLNVVAANVLGKNMILESLAQYSALMVMKHEFPEEKVSQFLQMQLDRYHSGRKVESKSELPLALVENQEYIYYSKGAINMYALQDYIGEESVNLALRRFLEDWNSNNGRLQKERFATTTDLIGYFRAVTPDSLQHMITDMFETNTMFENKITEATYSKMSEDQYKVNLTISAEKYRLDRQGYESVIHIDDWIDIGVYTRVENGKNKLIYLEKHKISDPNLLIEIVVNRPPTEAGIDPLHKLIDKKMDDNVISISQEGT